MPAREPYSDKPALDYLFHPESVAVAGVSGDMVKISGGRIFTENLIKAGYQGKIYPVGSSGGKVFGLRIYPSVLDIPGRVDYVISSIPAQYTPQLLRDCAIKGVKTVHMFTAGFSESGDKEGEELEAEITRIAQQKGIRILGPNCMGLYCPSNGLSFCSDFPRESGAVGFISQSGGHSLFGTMEATTRGIYFSKVISYGNASDLNESDFLEYLAADPETRTIAVYIEGVKQGQRFMAVLKQATRVKPVIVFKGGATEAGARTVASHTAAIAGSDKIWGSLIKQVGAIQVHSIEELFDVVSLFNYMSPPTGRNVAIIGLGGGVSVQAADACYHAGLSVPLLSTELSQKLQATSGTNAGKIFKNPVDIFTHGSRQFIQHVIQTIVNSHQIDIVMVHSAFDTYPVPAVNEVNLYVDALTRAAPEINKRTVVVLHAIASVQSKQLAIDVQTALAKAGFAVYPSFRRAANAIAKFRQYHQQQTKIY